MSETDESASLLKTIQSVSVPHMVFAATSAGILYNAGFFIVVGTGFVGLFSIQEHLVFALSGATFAALVAYGFVGAVVSLGMMRNPRVRMSTIAAAFVFTAFVVVKSIMTGSFLDPLLYLFFVSYTLGAIYRLGEKRVAVRNSVFAALIVLPFASGIIAGYRDLQNGLAPIAILESGAQFRLVRAGSTFTLLVDDDFVSAVPTASIKTIKWERLGPLRSESGVGTEGAPQPAFMGPH